VLQAVSPALAARFAFHLFLRTFRRRLQPDDAAALARARRHQLAVGPDPMTVFEWGPADGRTAIILHGWGSSAARFTRLAEALAARGWRVLVPDAPGHGSSPGRSSSLPKFIAGLDAIAAHFGPPEALIGHSLGALAITLRHAQGVPEWGHRLESIVLISMPSGAPFLLDVFVETMNIRAPARAELVKLFEKRFAGRLEQFTSVPAATHIAARLLVVHDQGDDIVPFAHGHAVVDAVAGAKLLTTRSLGHSALTRDAATIDAIVEFVDGRKGA
jgi:pimeloyl-ACP methyl ester carboxylesterase